MELKNCGKRCLTLPFWVIDRPRPRDESHPTFTYLHDDEGNRLSRTRKSSAAANNYLTEYAWDPRSRLASVTFKNNSGCTGTSDSFVGTRSRSWPSPSA
jgi:hypothetical protein